MKPCLKIVLVFSLVLILLKSAILVSGGAGAVNGNTYAQLPRPPPPALPPSNPSAPKEKPAPFKRNP